MKKNIDVNNSVVIVDYKLGNLFSVKQACAHVGLKSVVTSDKYIVSDAKAIILPGVGAFGEAMQNLEKLDLIIPLKDQIQKGVPFFGICLGMQLLFSESEEFGGYRGLDLVNGVVKKFASDSKGKTRKVPQVGWNTVYFNDQEKIGKSPLKSISQDQFMYFIHSYYTIPEKNEEMLTLTNYDGIEYCSSIFKDNIFATQFHPEKSAAKGIEIYKNWAGFILDK